MKRMIMATLVGGVVLYVWGAISWMVLPWHNDTFHSFENETAVVAAIKAGIPEAGTYYFPVMPEDYGSNQESTDSYNETHQAGPLGFLVYRPTGKDAMAPDTFIKSALFNFIEVALIAWLLCAAVGGLKTYKCRVGFVTTIGVIAGIASHGSMWVWFYFPTDWTVVMCLDVIVGRLLVGLVLAKMIKPEVS